MFKTLLTHLMWPAGGSQKPTCRPPFRQTKFNKTQPRQKMACLPQGNTLHR